MMEEKKVAGQIWDQSEKVEGKLDENQDGHRLYAYEGNQGLEISRDLHVRESGDGCGEAMIPERLEVGFQDLKQIQTVPLEKGVQEGWDEITAEPQRDPRSLLSPEARLEQPGTPGPPEDDSVVQLRSGAVSLVAQPGSTGLRPVAQLGSRELRSDAQPGSEAVRSVARVDCAYLILSDYIRWFASNKAKTTVYRQIHSGKFDLPVFTQTIDGRKYYYVQISDPQMIERIRLSRGVEKFFKEKRERVIHASMKISLNDLKAVNSVNSVASYDYKQFHKFLESIEKGEIDTLSIKIENERVEFVKKRIHILESDYTRLRRISQRNNINISKMITILLRNYLAAHYQNGSP